MLTIFLVVLIVLGTAAAVTMIFWACGDSFFAWVFWGSDAVKLILEAAGALLAAVLDQK